MRELQIFTNKKVGQMRGYIDASNTIHFNVEDSVKGLGFMTYGKNGETRIMWNIVRNLLKSFDYTKKVKASDYIPENIFYMLAMRADNPYAINFQKWIGNEVIPSIRKTGSYSVVEKVTEQNVARQSQVKVRKEATGIYELYAAYAKRQGDNRNPGRIYAKFSKLANRTAGIPDGCRELATSKQLKICAVTEKFISETLIAGIKACDNYKDIEESVMLRVAEIMQLTADSTKLLESAK